MKTINVKNVINEETGETEEVIVDEAALAEELLAITEDDTGEVTVFNEDTFGSDMRKRIAERRKQLGK